MTSWTPATITIYCTLCGNAFLVKGEIKDEKLSLAHISQLPMSCNKCGTATFTTDKPENTDVRNKEDQKRDAETA